MHQTAAVTSKDGSYAAAWVAGNTQGCTRVLLLHGKPGSSYGFENTPFAAQLSNGGANNGAVMSMAQDSTGTYFLTQLNVLSQSGGDNIEIIRLYKRSPTGTYSLLKTIGSFPHRWCTTFGFCEGGVVASGGKWWVVYSRIHSDTDGRHVFIQAQTLAGGTGNPSLSNLPAAYQSDMGPHLLRTPAGSTFWIWAAYAANGTPSILASRWAGSAWGAAQVVHRGVSSDDAQTVASAALLSAGPVVSVQGQGKTYTTSDGVLTSRPYTGYATYGSGTWQYANTSALYDVAASAEGYLLYGYLDSSNIYHVRERNPSGIRELGTVDQGTGLPSLSHGTTGGGVYVSRDSGIVFESSP